MLRGVGFDIFCGWWYGGKLGDSLWESVDHCDESTPVW